MSELEKQAESLIHDCEVCASTYEQMPGRVGPAAIIDLYRGIARLAKIVKLADGLKSIPARDSN